MSPIVANYHRIALSVPIDRVAARVARSGIQHVLITQSDPEVCSKDPLPLLRDSNPTVFSGMKCDPNFWDFTGMHWGRFTVVGLVNTKGNKAGGTPWSVRCVCGNYSTRKRGALKQPPKTEKHGMCKECFWKLRVNIRYQRWRERFDRWAANHKPRTPEK
jgi:hypothetical protein